MMHIFELKGAIVDKVLKKFILYLENDFNESLIMNILKIRVFFQKSRTERKGVCQIFGKW